MLGIVFSEFTRMIEDRFSLDLLDEILDFCGNPHDGAYTALGAYDHGELILMVNALSARTEVSTDVLIQAFGEHLIPRFRALYPGFFHGITNSFQFFQGIENTIHNQVLKLYPSAELPTIKWALKNENTMTIHYHSSRPFARLAFGLVRGGVAHFGETAEIILEGNSYDAVITIIKEV